MIGTRLLRESLKSAEACRKSFEYCFRNVMRVVLADSLRRSQGPGRGEGSRGDELQHELEPPPSSDTVLSTDPPKRPVVGDASPVVLATNMKREPVVARESPRECREAQERIRLDFDHDQAEFATAREAHAVDFVEDVS